MLFSISALEHSHEHTSLVLIQISAISSGYPYLKKKKSSGYPRISALLSSCFVKKVHQVLFMEMANCTRLLLGIIQMLVLYKLLCRFSCCSFPTFMCYLAFLHIGFGKLVLAVS